MTDTKREYLDPPRDLPLETKFGTVLITPTSGSTLYVHAGSNGRNDITIRGVAYTASLHLTKVGEAFEPLKNKYGQISEVYLSRRDNFKAGSDSARKACIEEFTRAANAWAAANPDALKEAERVSLNNDAWRIEEDLSELREKMAELHLRLAAVEVKEANLKR
jgi:hypothetical protein